MRPSFRERRRKTCREQTIFCRSAQQERYRADWAAWLTVEGKCGYRERDCGKGGGGGWAAGGWGCAAGGGGVGAWSEGGSEARGRRDEAETMRAECGRNNRLLERLAANRRPNIQSTKRAPNSTARWTRQRHPTMNNAHYVMTGYANRRRRAV